MGGIWQTAAFVFRDLSVLVQANKNWYQYQFILVLLAPLWVNAFVYMVMGRMVWNFLPAQKIFGIRATRVTLCFLLLDIIAFIIQAIGVVLASSQNAKPATLLLGLHIYQGGLAFQEAFLLFFVYLGIRFQLKLRVEGYASDTTKPIRLLYVLYAVITLITIRIVYRIVEYAGGPDDYIPTHEAFAYCLDSLPMFIALVLFNVSHPGTIMRGRESEFPSRKVRKQMKNSRKMENGHQLLPTHETTDAFKPTSYEPSYDLNEHPIYDPHSRSVSTQPPVRGSSSPAFEPSYRSSTPQPYEPMRHQIGAVTVGTATSL